MMKRLMTTLALTVCVSVVRAQTATPSPTVTPSMYALSEGIYEAEALSAPAIALSGMWTLSGTEPSYLVGDSGAVLSFDYIGRWLIIWRVTDTSAPSMDVCVNAICSSVGNAGSAQASAIVGLDAGVYGQHSVSITIGDGQVSLDKFGILQGHVVSATPAPVVSPIVVLMPVIASPMPTMTPNSSATPTPISFELYEATADVDGIPVTIASRRDFVVTTGDDQIAILLVGLLMLSGVNVIVQLWRR